MSFEELFYFFTTSMKKVATFIVSTINATGTLKYIFGLIIMTMTIRILFLPLFESSGGVLAVVSSHIKTGKKEKEKQRAKLASYQHNYYLGENSTKGVEY